MDSIYRPRTHFPPFIALDLLASCDAPAFTSVPEPGTAFTAPDASEWTKDTVPLHHFLAGDVEADFTPDAVFPYPHLLAQRRRASTHPGGRLDGRGPLEFHRWADGGAAVRPRAAVVVWYLR